jgi:polyisoprenyl-phosphate glycosyltransferase
MVPKFSVVVPVYNSEPSLEELFAGIKDVFARMSETFEVIFVEDSGADNSWEIIKKIKKENPDLVTGVKLSKNYGQHNATLCGFTFVRGDLVITIDDDLQTPPAEIRKLAEAWNESQADVVYGYYGSSQHSAIRKLGSTSLKKSSKILRDTLDEGSSFRLIRVELVKKLVEHPQHFIFIDEILQWYTDDILLVEVQHLPRKYRQSNYTSGRILSMVGNIMIFYTTIPLKILVYGGFTASFVTLMIGLYYMARKLFLNVPIPGYTSLIVAVLFSTSIILFSLGVIGEYLGRIYAVQNRKPAWSIKKVA